MIWHSCMDCSQHGSCNNPKEGKILFVTSGNGNTQEAGLINNNKKNKL